MAKIPVIFPPAVDSKYETFTLNGTGGSPYWNFTINRPASDILMFHIYNINSAQSELNNLYSITIPWKELSIRISSHWIHTTYDINGIGYDIGFYPLANSISLKFTTQVFYNTAIAQLIYFS